MGTPAFWRDGGELYLLLIAEPSRRSNRLGACGSGVAVVAGGGSRESLCRLQRTAANKPIHHTQMQPFILASLIVLSSIALSAAVRGAETARTPVFECRALSEKRAPDHDLMTLDETNLNTGKLVRQEYAVSREIIVDARDVRSASIITNANVSGRALELLLSSDGRKRLAAATAGITPSSHRQLALIVEGQLYSVVRAVGPVSDGRLLLSPMPSEDRARVLRAKILEASASH